MRDETSHLVLILNNYRRSVETVACKIGPRKQAKYLAGVDKTKLTSSAGTSIKNKKQKNIGQDTDISGISSEIPVSQTGHHD
jgi:hypothetical protein